MRCILAVLVVLACGCSGRRQCDVHCCRPHEEYCAHCWAAGKCRDLGDGMLLEAADLRDATVGERPLQCTEFSDNCGDEILSGW